MSSQTFQTDEAKRKLDAAASLLSQQIWCWGRDIDRNGGNLLLQRGFQRTEKPKGSTSSSIYQLKLSSTSRLVLRGFGVFFGDDRWGGLYVPRFEFEPKLTPEPVLHELVWSAKDLPPRRFPEPDEVHNCQRLLLALIEWIEVYEQWITTCVGETYRREILIDWNPKTGRVFPGEEMAAAWAALAEEVSEHPEHFIREA